MVFSSARKIDGLQLRWVKNHVAFLVLFVIFFGISYSSAFAGSVAESPLALKIPNKYQPYVEVGGARYFNQNSNTAGLYDLFIPILQTNDQIFFTDLRIFDRSGASFESNVHLGFRKLFLDKKQMFGVYTAYDHKRSDHRNHYNQLMVGAEYWCDKLFFGGNFYKPFGTASKLIKSSESITDKPTSRTINITEGYERALTGGDAEIGYALTSNLMAYGGGYYFRANGAETIAGPRARITYEYREPHGRVLGVLDGLSVEAGVQHDQPRGTTAYVGIKFKIGLTNLDKNTNLTGFERHMIELVRRDPDVVVGKVEKENKTQQVIQKSDEEITAYFAKLENQDFAQWNPEDLVEYKNWLIQKLELSPGVSLKMVGKAFREFAKIYHPDKCRLRAGCVEKEAENFFIEKSKQYEALKGIFAFQENQAQATLLRRTNLSNDEANQFTEASLQGIDESNSKIQIYQFTEAPLQGIDESNSKIQTYQFSALTILGEAIITPIKWLDYAVNQVFDMLLPIKMVSAAGVFTAYCGCPFQAGVPMPPCVRARKVTMNYVNTDDLAASRTLPKEDVYGLLALEGCEDYGFSITCSNGYYLAAAFLVPAHPVLEEYKLLTPYSYDYCSGGHYVFFTGNGKELKKLFLAGVKISPADDNDLGKDDEQLQKIVDLAKESGCQDCVEYLEKKIYERAERRQEAFIKETLSLDGDPKKLSDHFAQNVGKLKESAERVLNSGFPERFIDQAARLLDVLTSVRMSVNPNFARDFIANTAGYYSSCTALSVFLGTLVADGPAGSAGGFFCGQPVCLLSGTGIGITKSLFGNVRLRVENKGDGGKSLGENSGSGRTINPSKAESKVWRGLQPFKKDVKTNGLLGKDKEYYKWDKLHNDIEVYDRNGKHLGSKNPTTGEMYKPAKPGREIKDEL